ncbi:MAG: hypothetical protein JSS54_06335 [Proteobacteria bacterium]|nr:hypothetical protein [Pseudomonadota bacterium]MBS0268579.1 hypothetical protein [Pseudomonadota bacterium]
MKTTLGVAFAAAAMVLGAGFASAASVSSDVQALKQISGQSSVSQNVYWRHHRHCWWRHGHRHCRWW